MTNELEALTTLLQQNKLSAAPYKTVRTGKHYDVVIGIGRDHIANLVIDSEALDKLKQLTGLEFEVED